MSEYRIVPVGTRFDVQVTCAGRHVAWHEHSTRAQAQAWIDSQTNTRREDVGASKSVLERLEYLRSQIESECISWGEIAELQGLSEYIEAGDVVLLEWAGVPESDRRVLS